ncbi:MAG: heparinase II/III family protein [Acidobacteriota bacterium]|nr:heparinase II/III family protein [Acidobacteriota bacterium]
MNARIWLLRRMASALVLCLFVAGGNAQQRPPASPYLEPHVMREDFRGESLGQWASYPPAQDIGYEPSITSTGDYDAPGGRSLMRVVKPTRADELRFGFIKKVNLGATVDARLSFSYRLNAPSTNDGAIEIGLAGADARRYTAKLPARPNVWTTVETRLGDFRSEDGRAPASGIGIEAVYIVNDIKRADQDVTYRFLIDNVEFAAARAGRFKIQTPEAVVIEPWTSLVSAEGYRAGETIRIEAAAPARLARAECVLEKDGRAIAAAPLFDDGTHGDERAGDGVWSNNSVHTLRDSDPTGIWAARLQGTTADGSMGVSTPVRFIVHPPGALGHPRLFFTARDREELVARTRHPKLVALWTKLQERAKATRATGELAHGGETFEMLDREHLLPTLIGYFDILNRARFRIAYNALDAYITGNQEARDAAKKAMLDVARWPRWNPPWFEAHGQHTYYPAGQLAVEVAFGYDLLYDTLSPEERVLIRRALIERSIIPTFKEYVHDNRAMANTSNWISHTVGGALVAAAAIAGDGPAAEADGRFEVYVGGLLLKLEDFMTASFLADGSYVEGTSYQEFALETLGVAMPSVERVFGVDYFDKTHVTDSFIYSLYTLAQPTSESLDMGDTHPPSARTIAPFVARSKDPALRWYYGMFDHSSIIDFIFFDDSITPRPPALPASRVFPEKGNAVFRTGWGPNDCLLLYRAGPNFNHNHADQGSFLLTAFGETLVTEAGWSDYYKDPYYATFFTQAAGHNTVLLDGNPESQSIADTPQFAALDKYPRIIDFVTSEFYDALGSELSAVYRNRLDRYVRRVVFVKPHYFVIYDDLAARGAPATFDWLLHLPDRMRIKTTEDSALYTGKKAALAVRMFAPDAAKLSVRDGRLPYPVFASSTPKALPPQPAFLDFRTTAPAKTAQFLVALAPAREAESARRLIAGMSEISGDGVIGLEADRAGERDLVMFREGFGVARYKDWVTDAAAWTVTTTGERLQMLAVQSARTLTRAGRTLLSSEQPVSLAADYESNVVNVSLNAGAPTRLRLFIEGVPASVRIDGAAVASGSLNFSRADGILSVSVPAGQRRIVISLARAER